MAGRPTMVCPPLVLIRRTNDNRHPRNSSPRGERAVKCIVVDIDIGTCLPLQEAIIGEKVRVI